MTPIARLLLVGPVLALAGCATRSARGLADDSGGPPPPGDATEPPATEPDSCGDTAPDPACESTAQGPPDAPFPLQADQHRDPLEKDDGVNRNGSGWLVLDSSHAASDYLWIANSADNNAAGTVSKIDSRKVREVARYPTVTCFSLMAGSGETCDGTAGCCALDDWPRYQARKLGQMEPPHQAVQQHDNYPSRTSVDFNGDLFISNRAFGGQSSVTRIANDRAACVDRNHDGLIQTSKDSNGDGFIETDCNANGVYDSIVDVRQTQCTNHLPQEYFGPDDECVLWTSNTFTRNAVGRPLGLAAGGDDATASDAWAGSFTYGTFVRIDGTTGLEKDDLQLPAECYGQSGPYGLAIDAQGIGWTPDLWGPKLCYFDTHDSRNVGSVRDPDWGKAQAYGITLDRDQNIWIGGGMARYTPDRSNGFKNLGNGRWVQIQGPAARGIAADSRNATAYFVYTCLTSGVLQIPASTIPTLNMDQVVVPGAWPKINMPCYGVGVDADQNVWGVDMMTTTRAHVDAAGAITQPLVNGPPLGKDRCPAGDSCANAGAYTYSDFTGFGLRNFTRPQGRYQRLIQGCTDLGGHPQDTQRFLAQWDADVPPNTSLIVHAKSGASLDPNDASWSANSFTPDATISPTDLQQVLLPNVTVATRGVPAHDPYLLLEFLFKTVSQNATPTLKSFRVGFKCNIIG